MACHIGQPIETHSIWHINVFKLYLFSSLIDPFAVHCCSGSCPIMVWIHGGGFAMLDGSPVSFGPKLLMNFDVILVKLLFCYYFVFAIVVVVICCGCGCCWFYSLWSYKGTVDVVVVRLWSWSTKNF